MEFNSKVLHIDNIENTSYKIQEFIKNQLINFKRRGIVIGLSGGIDSAVTVSLCVKAIGKDKVLGVMMPERDSNPTSKNYAELLAKKLGIRTELIDLTKILDSFSVYQTRDSIVKKNFKPFNNSCKYRLVIQNDILEKDHIAIPFLEVLDATNTVHKIKLTLEDYLTITAATTIKLRVRMTMLYFLAEKNNYLVAGTTNKSEYVQGYFVKYGDGGVDFDPIVDLYKTQIYQLAEYLQIPTEIIKRKASPDTWSFEVSDQEFFFSLPYEIIDLLWYAKEQQIPIEKIERSLSLTKEQIIRIFSDQERKWKNSEHLRNIPPNLKLNVTEK